MGSPYARQVEHALAGLEAVSTGLCLGCSECADAEAHFSWRPCGICDSRLGGDREVWHAIVDGEIQHYDDACVDCVMFLANGVEPDEEV